MSQPIPDGLVARALVDGVVVAETSAALRVDEPGAVPVLWFPRWSLRPGTAASLHRAGEGALAEHVTFDTALVDLLLVDGGPGAAERDVTLKRFPTWGSTADLVAVLDAHPDPDGRWIAAVRPDWRRSVVEGSQLLGQAVVAGMRQTGGRRVVHASLVFPRVGSAAAPVAIELDEVSAGRTFSTLGVRGVQDGKDCAVGTLLLDAGAADLIRHGAPAPDVPGPYDAVPYDMGVTGRDLRIVGGAYTGDPDAPLGPPELDAWVRFRDVPDDAALHHGLLAQFTGHLSIAAALRPHAGVGQAQAHRTISTAINAIAHSVHADVRVDEWLLYHHHSTFAGDGMTHSECRVHREDGALVASFSVDAMVRAMPEQGTGKDERSAL